MGSLSQDIPDYVLEHCHLHTSARRNTKSHHFEVVNLFVDGSVFVGLREPPKCFEKLVQDAWALLLRRYLGNDTVSFAVLASQGNDLQGRGHARCIAAVEGSESRILQYHIPAQCLLQDIRPVIFRAYAGHVGERLPINTAIRLSNSTSSRRGQRNRETATCPDSNDDRIGPLVSLTPNIPSLTMPPPIAALITSPKSRL